MKLRAWLDMQGLTNRAFAKKIKVSESAVNRWTRSDALKRMPRPQYMKAIQRFTQDKVKPQDFYS